MHGSPDEVRIPVPARPRWVPRIISNDQFRFPAGRKIQFQRFAAEAGKPGLFGGITAGVMPPSLQSAVRSADRLRINYW